MYNFSDMGSNNNVPAFLTKLWTLVEDTSTDDMICWDPSGVSFHIYDQARFAKEILPMYFKHSNIASFIRQLNMYGFRKVIHMESGSIKSEWDDVEFHHPYFVRGEESLLCNIKRKQSAAQSLKPEPGIKLNHDDINRVLTDVQGMKEKQDTFTSRIDSMKRENEALWREVATLRQKHMKQQQIVNKLIEFMIHLVGAKKVSKTGLPLKRKMPLMLGDTNPQQVSANNHPIFGKTFSIEEVTPAYVVNSPAPSNQSDNSSVVSSGPEIHDVTDILLGASPAKKATPVPPAKMYSPAAGRVKKIPAASSTVQALPSSSVQKSVKLESPSDPLDFSLDSNDLNSLVDLNFLQALEPSTSEGNEKSMDRYNRLFKEGVTPTVSLPTEMNTQLDSMQGQIDDLKDLLSGTQYNFDPTTVLGLFNNENNIPSYPSNLEHDYSTDPIKKLRNTVKSEEETSGTLDPNTIIGNELVSFPLSLPSTYPDLSDLVSPDNTDLIQPSPQQEEEEGIITIDPMSFVNLPDTSGTLENNS